MNTTEIKFEEFPKMARYSRPFVITEKIDGTNAQIRIEQDGTFLIGSRTRWITQEDDNFGFARWCMEHKEELMTLGPGSHFGEWWGNGIQRGYGLKEKRFSLFNVTRWNLDRPKCCHVVPTLASGEAFGSGDFVPAALELLRSRGSLAAPGFMKPEGIVIFHLAGMVGFKKTLEKDDTPKSLHVN